MTLGRVTNTGYGYGYGYITGSGYHGNYATSAYIGGSYSNSIYISSYSLYSTYQNLKFKLYGKYIDSGAGVQFKLVLDDSTHNNFIDGTITPTVSYLMPDTLTIGTTSFDVTPAPTFAVVNDFTSADDY